MLKFNSVLDNLPIYQPGRSIEEVAFEMGLATDQIAKLASNENPLGASPEALAAMKIAISSSHRYPDGAAITLKSALSQKLSIPKSQIILGNGSNELIELLGHALLSPAANIVVSQYCFAIYPLVARLFGAQIISVPAVHFAADCEAMSAAINVNTKIVFIANPNNPTGTLCDEDALIALIEAAPNNVLIVIDEAYIEYLDSPQDLLPWIRNGKRQNVFLMRTFSKVHGLAGLRIGYGIGSTNFVSALEKVRQPFHCNSIAQAAAEAALGSHKHIQHSRLHNRRELDRYEITFQKAGWNHVPSFANFTLLRVGDGAKVFRELLKKGIITRPMSAYGLPDWLRISIGTEAENKRCIDALKQLLS